MKKRERRCPPRFAAIGSLIFSLFLPADCGGRVARPVQANSGHDHLLTCTHIKSEHTVNLDRIADIWNERKHTTRNNAGILIMSGLLFLNLNDSEQQEVDSLLKRNQVLESLSSKKSCGHTFPPSGMQKG